MYKILLLLSMLLFLNGCTQQNLGLSSLEPSPYSLEYLDARYKQTQAGNANESKK